MRKSESVIFRCSKELKEALDRLDNKTDYIMTLLIKDFQKSSNSDYVKAVELEKSIQRIKKQGQVINSGHVYLNMCSKAKTKRQKEILSKSFIQTLNAQLVLTDDENTRLIIQDTIKAFEDLKTKRGNKNGK